MFTSGQGARLPWLISLAAVFALASLINAAQAASDLTSTFVPQDQTNEHPTLELSDAACSAEDENNVECVAGSLICGQDGPISFEMTGFSDEELGKWLLSNGATATLKSGANSLPIQPQSMERDELNAGWHIYFQPTGGGDAWLRSLGPDPAVTVNTIQGDMALPTTPKDVAAMKEFLSACTAN